MNKSAKPPRCASVCAASRKNARHGPRLSELTRPAASAWCEAAAWERSSQIRRYVAALRQRAQELDSPECERVLEWSEWAADWADRSDPTRHTELIVGFDDRDEFGVPSSGYGR